MKKKRLGLLVAVAVSLILVSFPEAHAASFTGSKVAPRLAISSRTIVSEEFNSAVGKVFNGARFNGNACGGRDSYRKTTVSIPTINYTKEEPLPRLHYKLTKGETDSSYRKVRHSPRTTYKIRLYKMRACVNNWEARDWKGLIEGGKFKISAYFGYEQIKTRALNTKAKKKWRDIWADRVLPDILFRDLRLDVFLIPVVEGGKLTYSTKQYDIKANWFVSEVSGFDARTKYGAWEPSQLRGRVVDYKEKQMATMAQRVKNLFLHGALRHDLTKALTEHAKSGGFSNRTIVGVSGEGNTLKVTFR